MDLLPHVSWSLATLVALLAVSISDALYRRIPNALSLMVGLMGCSYWLLAAGWPGLSWALQGSLLGFGMMLVLYMMGLIGAGDVKVFAGFGALLGPQQIVWAALYGLLAGGVLSLVIIARHHLTLADLRQGLTPGGLSGALARARQRGATVPMAVALAAGVLWVGGGYA